MRGYRYFCFLMLVVSIVIANLSEASPWSQHVFDRISGMSTEPLVDDLLTLAVFSGVESDDTEDIAARQQAWMRLKATPDFADRLAGHIRAEKERWLSGKELSSSRYDNERSRTLAPMRNLPHPSVVRVLGEFLPDTEWPGNDIPIKAAMDGSPPPNALLAARALGQLIEKPPLQKNPDEYSLDDVKTWELWYAQVKAGTRTYRFKGDPQDYNFQGPVTNAIASAEARPHRREPTSTDAVSLSQKRHLPLASLVAAFCVLGVALWRFLGRRKQAMNAQRRE